MSWILPITYITGQRLMDAQEAWSNLQGGITLVQRSENARACCFTTGLGFTQQKSYNGKKST